MKTRILIVEDDPNLMAKLKAHYRAIFERHGHHLSIEQASTVEEARSLAKSAKADPYDLVSLDVNLGNTTLTGLDVLETLKRFQSAWMVALLTGIETDATVDKTMGKQVGDDLRKRLRRDAYARFPAERLLVVEKPSSKSSATEAETLLANRLEQIVLVYEEVGRLRFIFRPIEVASLERVIVAKGQKAKRKFIEASARHWQIRFNCGDIRTLPDKAGFRTLHHLLSRDRSETVTPEDALFVEPGNDKAKHASSDKSTDKVAAFFESKGIAWGELTTTERGNMVRAALSLKMGRFCELREIQDDGDLAPLEEEELERLVGELGPFSDLAEEGYQRTKVSDDSPGAEVSWTHGAIAQSGLNVKGGDYDRVGADRRGQDSSAAQLFRARMKRVKDCLRENGFADFAQHIEDYVSSTGANWSYNPPQGIEWTA